MIIFIHWYFTSYKWDHPLILQKSEWKYIKNTKIKTYAKPILHYLVFIPYLDLQPETKHKLKTGTTLVVKMFGWYEINQVDIEVTLPISKTSFEISVARAWQIFS